MKKVALLNVLPNKSTGLIAQNLYQNWRIKAIHLYSVMHMVVKAILLFLKIDIRLQPKLNIKFINY